MKTAHSVLVLCLLLAVSAAAQEAKTDKAQSDKKTDAKASESARANGAVGNATLPAEAIHAAQITKKYESVLPWDNDASRYPGVGDTLTGEVGGIRPWMLKYRMGLETIVISSFNYNLAHPPMYGANGPDANGNYYPAKAGTAQAYIGQRPTWYVNSIPSFTWGITKSTQLHIGMYHTWTTCEGCSQNDTLRFQSLNIKQYFLDKRLRITFGFTNSATQFWGPYTAGNLAGSLLGSLSFMPQLAGESSAYAPTPALTVRYNLKNGAYTMSQVARSTDPNIYTTGNYHDVFESLHLHIPGAKAFLSEELGYKKTANRSGQMQRWIRGDVFYNFSKYADYRKFLTSGKTENNFCLAELADLQLTQPDPGIPWRGSYIGNKIMYAPPQQNLYSQYYELSYYYLAPFRKRPFDLWNVSANVMQYSKPYLAMLEYYASKYHKSATYYTDNINVKSQYVARIKPGLNWNVAFDFDIHPTTVPKTPNAFVGQTGLVMYF